MSGPSEHERLHGTEPLRAPEPEAADPAEPLRELASSVGNRAFGEAVARQGDGILPNGQVHPAVQSTLDSTRGGGTSLDPGLQSKFSDSLGDLSDVRVHIDDTADHLSRAVSARAFATGTDVYFARGEYNPGSAAGDKLIAHELAHTVQQRGAPQGGPLSVSEPGDAMEREADSVADSVV